MEQKYNLIHLQISNLLKNEENIMLLDQMNHYFIYDAF